MQFKIFTIPLLASDDSQEELNQFLRAHRVVDVRKELATADGNQFWTFCISYLADAKSPKPLKGRSEKVDYKQILSPVEFERFSKMRKIRKDLSEAEALPPFVVFTDAELAEFAKQEVLTLAEMRNVEGVGDKKLEKFGKYFLTQTDEDEKSGASD